MTVSTMMRAPVGSLGRYAPASRLNVLWVGGQVPDGLRAECARSGFHLMQTDTAAIQEAAPTARALVLEYPTGGGMNYVARAQPIVRDALLHGLGVAITHAPDTPPQDYFGPAQALQAGAEGRVIAPYKNWVDIAQFINSRDIEPGASPDLNMEGDVPTDPELRLLLRRAFHDMRSVTLAALPEGRSGAEVWVVHAGPADAARYPNPFLVKAHTIAKIVEERRNYEQHIKYIIGSRHRPNMHDDRHVMGAVQALLIQDFIGDARCLADTLPWTPAATVIGSLFGSALRGCWAGASERKAPLAIAFGDLKALRWSPELEQAARAATASGAEIPEPTELRRHVEALPPIAYRESTVHGDLHAGNVFVATGSPDVLLIDFGRSMRAPTVADPACLEVSVTFPSVSNGADADPDLRGPLDTSALRDLYQYPLDPAAVPAGRGHGERIMDAVKVIRSAARQREADPIPYAFAVASYLLRFASYADHATVERRALAYDLACDLFSAVHLAVDTRNHRS